MLVVFLNGLLFSDELPRELHRAQVVLIPKLACISKPGDYRPINLIESLHKVFSWLLVNRLSSSWETPSMQMAGVRGRQVCDALLSAQYRVLRDSKEQQYDLYLSCDVQSAFDSLNHETIAHFLLRHCPCHQGREALQMLRLLVSPELCFYWRGHWWQTEQSSGVQQGGSHSAAIFAYILGLACQQLETTWMSEGETTRHTTFSLLFMDDLLISFGGWSQAVRLTKRLQQTLAELGLQLNPKKTCLMSHPSVLELGQQYPFPDDCLLNHISWVTECVYLRKPLTHFQSGSCCAGRKQCRCLQHSHLSAGKATHLAFESLQRCMRKGHWGCASDTVLLCNTYLGSTWFWYSPLIEPLTKYVSKMRTMQTTFLSLMLGLYIPATVSSHAALLLHRLRRRLVLVLLNHMPSRQWTVIWAKRRWGYLGHTLRREAGTDSRQDMLALCSVRQSRPGPFHHLAQWGGRLLACDTENLIHQATDRDSWACTFNSIEHHFRHDHPVIHAMSPSTRWSDVLRTDVSWKLGAFLRVVEGYVSVDWLHEIEGFQHFFRGGDVFQVFSAWVQWLQLEFFGIILLDAYLLDDKVQAQGDVLARLHNHVYDKFGFIAIFTSC